MNHHEYSNLFPMLNDVDLQKLANDIAENGQHQPVMIDEKGQILDGRNRSAACALAGIEPATKEFNGTDSEKLAYVLSVNLHRRHLDTSQRAMVAEKLASLKQGEKKADTGIPVSPPSQAEAAAMLNVSVDSVQKARKIRKAAKPETIAAVERGELSLNAAVETVKPAATNPESAPESQRAPRHAGEHNESKVFAIGTADVAITQLKSIPIKNNFRDAAFARVQKWIGSQTTTVATEQSPTAIANVTADAITTQIMDMIRTLPADDQASTLDDVITRLQEARGALEPDASNVSGVLFPDAADDVQHTKRMVPTDAEFEAFWKAFPRRVKKPDAKKAFAKAFRLLRKTLDPKAAIDTIMTGVALYAKHADPGVLCHPTTWLNGCRWEDDPEGIGSGEKDSRRRSSAMHGAFTEEAAARCLEDAVF